MIKKNEKFPSFFSATQLWRKKVADIAKDYKDIKFAIADDDEYMASAMKDFGLDDTGEEFNIGCYKDGKKYGMEPMEEYDGDEIREFLKKLQKGMITVYYPGCYCLDANKWAVKF